MLMNKTAYEIEKDRLIYDGSHPITADNVEVTVPTDSVGEFERGQILDFSDGAYSVHTENGTASVIVAETTSYASDDTTIVVPVYTSGCFRQSACKSDVDLNVTDLETLRSKGIYLK